MEIQIKMTVEVDPADWCEVYGMEHVSTAAVRWDVKNWFQHQALHHPDGLFTVVEGPTIPRKAKR